MARVPHLIRAKGETVSMFLYGDGRRRLGARLHMSDAPHIPDGCEVRQRLWFCQFIGRGAPERRKVKFRVGDPTPS